MLAEVCSAPVNGIEAYPVEVEVNTGYGGTSIVIVPNLTPKPPAKAPRNGNIDGANHRRILGYHE